SVGELVGGDHTSELATIVQIDPIWVWFNLSERDVQRGRAQLTQQGVAVADLINKAPVEVGLQTDAGYPHKGLLDYVSPDVNQSTGTLQVRAIFENAKQALLPGYFVRVRVPLRAQQALLVPEVAVGADQAGRYVLVVNADGIVELLHRASRFGERARHPHGGDRRRRAHAARGRAISQRGAADHFRHHALPRRERARGGRHRRAADRAAGQRRRRHDLYAVLERRRRQLHADRHLQDRNGHQLRAGAGAEPGLQRARAVAAGGTGARRDGTAEIHRHSAIRDLELARRAL